MITINTATKNALNSASRKLAAKIKINNVEYDAHNFSNISITSSLTEGGSYNIGSASAAHLQLTIIHSDIPKDFDFSEYPIEIYIGIEANNDYVWFNQGKFWVNRKDIKKNKITTDIEAHGILEEFDKYNYETNLEYPTNLLEVLTEIKDRYADLINIVLPTTTIDLSDIEINQPLKGSSVRNVLRYIALICGGNWVEYGDSVKILQKPTKNQDNTWLMDGHSYISLSLYDNNQVNITGLQCTIHDGETQDIITAGTASGGTVIIIGDDVISSQYEIDTIYNNAEFPFTYSGYSVDSKGFPHLQLGDFLELTDTENTTHNFIIMNNTLTFSGGMKNTFSAEIVEDELQTNSTYVNSITASIKDLIADNIKVTALTANMITADNFEAQFANISEATIDSLFSGNITATGSITGVDIITDKGNIGGWNITNKNLSREYEVDDRTYQAEIASGKSIEDVTTVSDIGIRFKEDSGDFHAYSSLNQETLSFDVLTNNKQKYSMIDGYGIETNGAVSIFDSNQNNSNVITTSTNGVLLLNGVPLSDIYLPLSGGTITGNLIAEKTSGNISIRNANNNTGGAAHFSAGSSTCSVVGEMDFYSTGGKAANNTNSRIRLLAPANLEPASSSASYHNVILPSSGGTLALISQLPTETYGGHYSTVAALITAFRGQTTGTEQIYDISAAVASSIFGYSGTTFLIFRRNTASTGLILALDAYGVNSSNVGVPSVISATVYNLSNTGFTINVGRITATTITNAKQVTA